MMNLYRSPYEAYPFLADSPEDLRCDFELLTDEISSLTGLLAACVEDTELKKELLHVDELVYHANPTLRTKLTVTQEEVQWLKERTQDMQREEDVRHFVLPQGCLAGSIAHVLRVKAKELVRLLYRHAHQGREAEPLLFDFCNLLSGYYFSMALKLNRRSGAHEIAFVSRNY